MVKGEERDKEQLRKEAKEIVNQIKKKEESKEEITVPAKQSYPADPSLIT